MSRNKDDVIWVEEIDSEKQPIVGVYKEVDGTISFYSTMTPLQTARIFAGLANHILEKHCG